MENTNKTAETLYNERLQRVTDAISLKKPDRVPAMVLWGLFPATYKGYSCKEVMYEQDKMLKAWIETIDEFEPDMVDNPYTTRYLGPLLGALDCTHLQWPGHGMADDAEGYQFVEGEYMKADEYEHFSADMSDFMVRRYWPRVFGALSAFSNLPPLNEVISYYMGVFSFAAADTPEMHKAFETILAAAAEAKKVAAGAGRYVAEMKNRGFPAMSGCLTQVPYDTLGDFFRGTRGIMLDMYQRPDKLKAALDQLLPIMVRIGVNGCKRTGIPRAFIPLHKGPKGFMSNQQYAEFYWPGFRDLMLALIDEGITPCPFVEGDYGERLDFLADVPPGKVMYHFEATDLFKAKEALRDIACIRGNVPLSLLATASEEAVRDYCRKLIDVVGEGGGFVLDASTVMDDAKPENVRALFECARDYGVYQQ